MPIVVTPPTYATPRPTKHPKYYLNGGDLHLLIRGQLFRVHSYFFDRDSTRFFPELTCGHESHRGDSDDTPITVDVDPTKFEKLLWVFYNPTYSLYDTSIGDWVDILELADEWSFAQVKRLAIRELQKLSLPTANRIALYQKYNINCEFLIPLYAELCSRPDILTLEEATLIGMQASVIVFQLREELRTPLPPTCSSDEINQFNRDIRTRVAAAFEFPPETANIEQGPISTSTRPILNSNGRTTFAGRRIRNRS